MNVYHEVSHTAHDNHSFMSTHFFLTFSYSTICHLDGKSFLEYSEDCKKVAG
jgi:hypothetical protein